MIKIDKELLNSVSQQAQDSPRKRMNYNFHPDAEDSIQRMLNAMNTGTYVRPHRHITPIKREAFIILRGRIAVIEFDDHGSITAHTILDASTGSMGVEVSEGGWHTLVVLEDNSIVYEVKDGPYFPIDDKNFASWAPVENAPGNACQEYLHKLIQQLNL